MEAIPLAARKIRKSVQLTPSERLALRSDLWSQQDAVESIREGGVARDQSEDGCAAAGDGAGL